MFLNNEHEKAYQLMQNMQYEQAVVVYSQCITLHPESPELYSERGVAYIHLQQKDKSLSDLNRSVDLQPDYAYRYASRGHAKDFFGDLDGAIEDYEMAAELDPNDAIIYNNLGLLLEKKGNMMMASEYYKRSDDLRKQEANLQEVISELEGAEQINTKEQKTTHLERENSDMEEPSANRKASHSREIKKIFTQKSQWKEFIHFIKNGFKLK